MLTLLLALALAACGDDDNGGGGGPSKEDFIQAADKLCRETDEKGTALAEEAFADPAKPTPAEAQQFVRDAIPVQRDLLAELRELDRPEGDEAEIERWLDAADDGTDEVERMGENRDDSLTLLRSNVNPLAEANALASEYGLDDCSN